jgi:hypothetical protein
MFEQAIQAGEAGREAMHLSAGPLIPALYGCAACQTIEMIAGPVLGICPGCGAERAVISYEDASVAVTTPARDRA